LKPGGRLAAVLPQTTLTGEAFGVIVKKLTQEYTIDAVVVGLGRSAFSENTSLSEILFVAEKMPPRRNHRFALIGTKKSPTEWTMDDLQSFLSGFAAKRDYNDNLTVAKWIPQQSLSIDKGGLTKLLPQLSDAYGELSRSFRPILRSPLMIPYIEYETKSGIQAFMSPLGNREIAGSEGRGGVFYGSSALNIARMKRER